MTNNPPNPLDNLSQTIHATLLSPPAQFLLISSISKEQWTVTLFNTTKDVNRVWVHEQFSDEIRHNENTIADTIKEGLLHVDCGSRRQVDLTTLKSITLHILVKDDPLIFDLKEGDINEHIGKLLGATYQLLSSSEPKKNVSNSEVKELKMQLLQKDSEISSLNSKLSSLKATVVRATASDVNKKKVQQSPQKQKPLPGASQLQPNQKRRKVVEDEFAGSSSDEDDD